METTTTSSQLEYAPPLPWQRRPWARRALLVGMVAAVVAVVAALTPSLWHRFQLVRLQRACLAHRDPPDAVAYESLDLFNSTDHPDVGSRSMSETSAVPTAWTEFYGRLQGTGPRTAGMLFLHERRSPSGARRLVAVDVSTMNMGFFTFHARLFSVGSFLRPAAELPSAIDTSDIDGGGSPHFTPGHRSVRLYAGQPDQNDPTHFTIDLELDGQRRTLDGWLRDDDTVVIESRE